LSERQRPAGFHDPPTSKDSIVQRRRYAIDLVVFGIRPEHVVIEWRPAEIVTVETTGSETHATAVIGKQGISCVFRTRLSIAPGDTVPLSFAHGPNHFSDAATIMRI
jgi:multiple sugar transport system ATP-binding protein